MNAVDILKYGHLTVLQTLDGFSESAWDTPGACGVWSVKDVIAHLASYEQVLVDVLTTFLGGGPCIGYLGHPFVKKTSWAFITLLFLFIRWYFAIDRGGPCFSCTGCRRGLPETASDTTLPAGCTSSTDWPLEHVVPLQAAQR